MTYPTIMPALTLDFQNSKQLDPRVTFSRSSGATYINDAGLVVSADEHEPRFDHDPVTGECLGLLIEESRTNSLTDSEGFTEFNKVRVTDAAATGIVDPMGGAAAVAVTETVDDNTHFINDGQPNNPSLLQWTLSVYVKPRLRDYVMFDSVNAMDYGVIFDLVNGVNKLANQKSGWDGIYTVTQERLANGWWRLSQTGIFQSAGGNNKFTIMPVTSYDYADKSYPGDTSAPAMYVYGAQVEAGSFLSSYIPTAGSTITRSADIAQMTGDNFSSWYDPLENSMLIKFSTNDTSANYKPGLVTYDSTKALNLAPTVLGSQAFFYEQSGNPNFYNNVLVQARTARIQRTFAPSDPSYNSLGQFNTAAQGYAGADSADSGCFLNGTPPSTESSAGQNPGTVDSMWIGRDERFGTWLNGHISRIAYYNERLTDAELQTLTS